MEHRGVANVRQHTTAVKHQAHHKALDQKMTSTEQQRHLMAMQRPTNRELRIQVTTNREQMRSHKERQQVTIADVVMNHL